MVGISFILDGEAATGSIAKLHNELARPQAVYDAIGAYFVFSTQRNIEVERSPEGRPWPRLTPRTAERRVEGNKKRGDTHMLRVKPDVGLYASVSYRVLADGVEWGSHLKYARIHQLGGTIDQPARQASVSLKAIRTKGNHFARIGTKGARNRLFSIRRHQVTIPPRPYLGIKRRYRRNLQHCRRPSGKGGWTVNGQPICNLAQAHRR